MCCGLCDRLYYDAMDWGETIFCGPIEWCHRVINSYDKVSPSKEELERRFRLTPLGRLKTACEEKDLETVKDLIHEKKVGIDDFEWKTGDSPLYMAASCGALEIVKWMLYNAHANKNIKNRLANTPMFIAAEKGHLDVVQFLIEKCSADVEKSGADSKRDDINGVTPLWNAAAYGHLEIVKYLVVVGGADVDHWAQDGRSPLWAAAFNKQQEVMDYLVKEAKADINLNKGYNNRTLLYKAIEMKDEELANFCIDNGADVDLCIRGESLPGRLNLHCQEDSEHLDSKREHAQQERSPPALFGNLQPAR
mmetsp:Transcript_13029/g.26605  ORF Transcript_13029/g.26605 Transcript_13029/m.26605 type:complete len:307 (+) Transcript_13029:149-1069(+)